MKITILGANSYIARNMIYLLKGKEDIELSLYDYQETHLDGEASYQALNILDKNAVASVDLKCDIIYMFIGKTGTLQGFDDFETYININEKALLNVLSAYREQKSEAKIVFPSTRLVYKGSDVPQTEDAEKEFKTLYAINKYACEQYLEMYHRMFDVKYLILRICVPYGTMIPNASSYGTAEFMLGKAMKKENISLYGDGQVRRTLVHMEDLCNVLYEAAIHEECVNDIFNIGGEDYSLKEMANLVASQYGVGVDYVDWPQAALKIESGSTVFDAGKLQSILHYEFRNSFEGWIVKQ